MKDCKTLKDQLGFGNQKHFWGTLGLGARDHLLALAGSARRVGPMAKILSCDSLRPPGIFYLISSLFAGLLLPRAVAFNLDVMGALRKEGQPGSLFGFSVALHRQLQPRSQSW